MPAHPIRVTVADDLGRSRLTVFFRLLLAIPHLVWLFLWTIAAILAAVASWFATLVAGRSPEALHRFLAAYLRYVTHVYAYVLLAANPFPGFTGSPGSYPIDLEVEPPQPQSRWRTGFRLLLALPALILGSVLLGGGANGGDRWGGDERYGDLALASGVATTVAILAWFACLARGRMPRGFRDLVAYALGYSAQSAGYVLLLTDRYPNSDPLELAVEAPPESVRPLMLTVADDRRRSRLTVFFRLLLAIPHLVWLFLWWIAAFFAAIASWFATLVAGRTPEPLHRFLAAFVRYQTHVYAFVSVSLVANPFPGFVGQAGSYPIDLEIAPARRQNRWITAFRLPLGLPAYIVHGALGTPLFVAAVLGWFASLATGRMPLELRNLGAYVLRYAAQTYGYLYLLTDRYPFSGPVVRAADEPEDDPEALAA